MATVAGRAERARKDVPKSSAAPTTKPSEDEIRLLAYRLYERRCASGTAGDAAVDWSQAEQLLSDTLAANTSGN
jgi:DUF2934 family protein